MGKKIGEMLRGGVQLCEHGRACVNYTTMNGNRHNSAKCHGPDVDITDLVGEYPGIKEDGSNVNILRICPHPDICPPERQDNL